MNLLHYPTLARLGTSLKCARAGLQFSAALLGTLILAMGLVAPGAWAQNALTSQQIVSKLKSKPAFEDDEDSGLPGKALGKRPDPITRLCEPRGQGSGTSTSSDNAFRNLVARPAPKVDLTVEFDFAKATLRADGAAQLDALAVALKDPSFVDSHFVLSGHTDAVGSVDANDRLSCERALTAKRYLADRHHIAANRVIVMGFGASMPINLADPLAASNRRVEVKLLPGS